MAAGSGWMTSVFQIVRHLSSPQLLLDTATNSVLLVTITAPLYRKDFMDLRKAPNPPFFAGEVSRLGQSVGRLGPNRRFSRSVRIFGATFPFHHCYRQKCNLKIISDGLCGISGL
jgi:hypothetical protein